MSLTPTEERIAGLVALGHRNDEVAAELGVSPKTVEWQLSRLYRRLGVRSRTELSVVLLRGNPLGSNGPKDEPNGRFRSGASVSASPPEAQSKEESPTGNRDKGCRGGGRRREGAATRRATD